MDSRSVWWRYIKISPHNYLPRGFENWEFCVQAQWRLRESWRFFYFFRQILFRTFFFYTHAHLLIFWGDICPNFSVYYWTDVLYVQSRCVAKSPAPATHTQPQHKMAPHCRTPGALLSLSMKSSYMAPNHGAEPPHESDAPGGAGSFSPLSFHLFWALKHDPSKMRVGDGGLRICDCLCFEEATTKRTSLGAVGEGMKRRNVRYLGERE